MTAVPSSSRRRRELGLLVTLPDKTRQNKQDTLFALMPLQMFCAKASQAMCDFEAVLGGAEGPAGLHVLSWF